MFLKYILLLLIWFPIQSHAEENQPAEKERTGFISLRIGSGFTFPKLLFSEVLGDITYGGQLSPQSNFEAGIGIVSLVPGLILKYNYEFIEKAPNNWIPGVNASISIGMNLLGEDNLALALGTNVGFFVERFISSTISVLISLGIRPDPIIINSPKIAVENAYFAVGARWYLR